MEFLHIAIFLLVLVLVVDTTPNKLDEFRLRKETQILELKIKIAEQDKLLAEQNNKICSLRNEVLTFMNKKSKTSCAGDEDEGEGNSNDSFPVRKAASLPDYPDYQGYEEKFDRAKIGVTFIRWGHTECPINTSHPVYKGTVGGSYYSTSGGAAEYVCLPEQPTWNKHKLFRASKQGLMYGGEYEILPDASLDDYSAPCVVCEANPYTMSLMIPGRDRCYPGWTTAYSGNLASGHSKHNAPTEYICLDANPITTKQDKKGSTGHDGKLIYTVHARCGALPCPPYEEDALLACVVCLK